MSFYWSDYLGLAGDLAVAGSAVSEEARFRSAISRAYYAAFHEAKDYLASRGDMGIPTDGAVHAYVCDKFRFDRDLRKRQVGQHLSRLRIDRNAADYNRPEPRIAAMTGVALDWALQAITEISTLP